MYCPGATKPPQICFFCAIFLSLTLLELNNSEHSKVFVWQIIFFKLQKETFDQLLSDTHFTWLQRYSVRYLNDFFTVVSTDTRLNILKKSGLYLVQFKRNQSEHPRGPEETLNDRRFVSPFPALENATFIRRNCLSTSDLTRSIQRHGDIYISPAHNRKIEQKQQNDNGRTGLITNK